LNNEIALSDSLQADTTLLIEINAEIDPELLHRFEASAQAPYFIDSVFLGWLYHNPDSTLTEAEVVYLSFGYVETEISYSGKFHASNVKDSDALHIPDPNSESESTGKAYLREKVIVNDGITLLLWHIDFTSAEGCGSSRGALLYASVLVDNVVTSCTVLGENSESGEAGYSGMSTTVFSIEPDATGKVTSTEISTDEDMETGEEATTTTVTLFEFFILDGKWEVTKIDTNE